MMSYIRIGILILIIGSLLSNVVLYKQRKTFKIERNQLQQFAKVDSSTISWYKNKLNRETAKIPVLELTNRNLKELLDTERLRFAKQFEGVKKNGRNIAGIGSADIGISKTTTVKIDSSWTIGDPLPAGFSPVWEASPGITFTVVPGDSLRIRQTFEIRLEGAIFWQRKRLLGLRIGRRIWEADLSSPDSSIHIKQIEVIRISRKK